MKNIIRLTIIILFAFANNSFAETYWDKTFGGDGSDRGYSVQQTTDLGYIIVGYTTSYGAGSYDIWLIKTDSVGNKLWDRTFGGASSDKGYSVQQTSDGGYIITGYTESYGAGGEDVWLIKTGPWGWIQWDKTYGGANNDYGKCVQQTSDGGYIITGGSWYYNEDDEYRKNFLLIKTDQEGNLQWDIANKGEDKTARDDAYLYGNYVEQTSDGGYIITGGSGYTFYWDTGWYTVEEIFLTKKDANGNPVWSKYLYDDTDFCYSDGVFATETSDGGFMVIGNACSVSYSPYTWMVKTDSYGNKIWDKSFSHECFTGAKTSDMGYIISGYNGSDTFLIKTNANGNKQWEKTTDLPYSKVGFLVKQTIENGYIVTGYSYTSENDVWLYYYNPDYETNISDLNLLFAFLITLFLGSFFLSYKARSIKL